MIKKFLELIGLIALLAILGGLIDLPSFDAQAQAGLQATDSGITADGAVWLTLGSPAVVTASPTTLAPETTLAQTLTSAACDGTVPLAFTGVGNKIKAESLPGWMKKECQSTLRDLGD